ncbi:hypothetical protein [Paraburkholderia sp. MM5477-R1]|uniref:hypothetical protein n=1 Tax=Paraburkholderia sp. MM5477-R1 TaxID=2991062 RepID=UPI003D1DAFC6
MDDSVSRQRDFIRQIDNLESERLQAIKKDQKLPPSQYQELQVFRSEYKSESDNMVELASSLDANLRRLEEIKALRRRLATDGQTGPALISTMDEPQFSWGLIHRFEAIDELCRAARWFKSVKVAPLQNERLAMLLKIFARENRQPPLALLDRDESDAAIEALTALIRRRLDRQSVGALAEGYETFESLGLTVDVDKTLERLPVWKTERLETAPR